MPKVSSFSFVIEHPLVVRPVDERRLLASFEAGRRLFNATLHDGLQRLDRMRKSSAWAEARALPKGQARTQAFRDCRQAYGFSEYDLQSMAIRHKNAAGFAGRLGAHETQKIASLVWKAVKEHAFGGRGRPRFKGRNRPLHSLEGKSSGSGIRWNDGAGCAIWNKQVLPARLPTAAQDP